MKSKQQKADSRQINNGMQQNSKQKNDKIGYINKDIYCKNKQMDNEPRWLDIEDELYPQFTITKQILFENTINGHFNQFHTEIRYNSFKREIDLTSIVFKYFFENSHVFNSHLGESGIYELLIRDKFEGKLHLVGYFPTDDTYTLGENFLSQEILYLIVQNQQSNQQQIQSQALKQQPQEKAQSQNDQDQQYQDQEQNVGAMHPNFKVNQHPEENSKAKPNKRKTIQEVLKIIAEWRKLIMIKKIPPSQAADKIGMSKRSLQDYFTIIKLAEKYGFDFQTKMKSGFAELRTFVKENHQTRPAPKVQILQKFKNTKK